MSHVESVSFNATTLIQFVAEISPYPPPILEIWVVGQLKKCFKKLGLNKFLWVLY